MELHYSTPVVFKANNSTLHIHDKFLRHECNKNKVYQDKYWACKQQIKHFVSKRVSFREILRPPSQSSSHSIVGYFEKK